MIAAARKLLTGVLLTGMQRRLRPRGGIELLALATVTLGIFLTPCVAATEMGVAPAALASSPIDARTIASRSSLLLTQSSGVGSPVGSTFDFEIMVGDHTNGSGVTLYTLGTGSNNITFNGVAQDISPYCCGLGTTPSVTEAWVDHGDGTATITIAATVGAGQDLMPGGLTSGGQPLTDGGIVIGHFHQGDPLDWTPSHSVLSATVDVLAGGVSILGGPASLDPATFFGAPGAWDGFVAVGFNNAAGKGVTQAVLTIVVTAAQASGNCSAPSEQLVVQAQRFAVSVSWTDFSGNTGCGQPVQLTPDTGYFWFFDAANVELVVKVLDARALDQYFWVFYEALSSVQYTIMVTDTQTGATRTYSNPSGQLASVADTSAFGPFPPGDSKTQPHLGSASRPHPIAGTAAKAKGCAPDSTTLCLSAGRFAVTAMWRDFQGNSGTAAAVPLTADTGYFWFFDPSNVEVVLKVLDGRGLNSHFWVFYGALSSVDYVISVVDTTTGATRVYDNQAGNLASVADVTAFTGSERPADSASVISSALAPFRRDLTGELANTSPSVGQFASALDNTIGSLQTCLTSALRGSATCKGLDYMSGALVNAKVDAQSAATLAAFLSTADLSTGASRRVAAHSAESAGVAGACVAPLDLYRLNARACDILQAEKPQSLVAADFATGFLCGTVPLLGWSSGACAAYELLSLCLDIYQATACDFAPVKIETLAMNPTTIPMALGAVAPFAIDMTLVGKAGPPGTGVADNAAILIDQSVKAFLKRTEKAHGLPPGSLSGPVAAPLKVSLEQILKPFVANLPLHALSFQCTASGVPTSIAGAELEPGAPDGLRVDGRFVYAGETPGSGTLTPHLLAGAQPWNDGALSSSARIPATVTVGSCTYVVTPATNPNFPSTGGAGTIGVTATQGCTWTASVTAGADFIGISSTSNNPGTTSGTVTYTVAANPGAAQRDGAITIAGDGGFIGAVDIVEGGTSCTYSLNPQQSQPLPATGGSGSFTVNAPQGCPWTALSQQAWIAITSNPNGSGTGEVAYSVAANSGPSQVGTIDVAGLSFTITEAGGSVDCTTSYLSDSNLTVPPGGSALFDVYAPAGCGWTAAVEPPDPSDPSETGGLIAITSGASGIGNGEVDFSVAGCDSDGDYGAIDVLLSDGTQLGPVYILCP